MSHNLSLKAIMNESLQGIIERSYTLYNLGSNGVH